jgi:hypothetical protein
MTRATVGDVVEPVVELGLEVLSAAEGAPIEE